MIKTPRPNLVSTALTIAFFATALVLSGCGGSVHPSSAATTVTPAPPAAPPSGSSGSAAPSSAPTVLSYGEIEDLPDWTSCANTMNGHECAGGRGFAPTSIVQHITDPSLAGSSSHFWLGGKTPYSNVMWWRHLEDGDPKATKYRYEFNVFMKRPDLPEALEFDVNQSAKGIRWVFGTECNFKGTHRWDVWDAHAHWVPTQVPCNAFQANTWNHVAWNFERVGDQAHYISLEVNGTVYQVNMYTKAEKNWPWAGELNVAFQMDGDNNQDNFDVWLDQVSLAGWQ